MILFKKTFLHYSLLTFFILSYSKKKVNPELKTSKDIAYSNPIKKITIDGSIEDWPKNIVKYPIDIPLINPKTKEEDDFSAYFMSGFRKKENTLYLAIVIKDDEFVLGSKEENLNSIDAYLLYIDEQHLKKGSGISRYVISENQKHIINAEVSWDPKMAKLSTWDNVTYKISSNGNTKIYEIKIKLATKIYNGRTIGLSHMINDKDKDKREIYAWNRMPSHIIARPVNLGTLVFQKNNKNLGRVEGKIAWKDTLVKNKNPRGVYAISKKDYRKWYYIQANRKTGHFSATLPKDEYLLKPGKTAYHGGIGFRKVDTSNALKFKIRANQITSNVNLDLHYLKAPDLTMPTNLLASLDKDSTKIKLDKVIKSYMDYYQIEGVSFTAFKGDEIYTKTYGVKNNYTKEAVNKNTLFEAASVTKSVFAYTVMRLYDKGLLNLDEPLYKYLPFEKSSNTAYNKLLTARIILSHKSGLPNWGNSSNIKYSSKPGTKHTYSGEAFEYLKRVIEKITNKDMNTILNSELVEPLGLENMYFKADSIAMKNKSHGHLNGLAIRKDLQSEVGVSHSLVTNSQSFAKFVMALKNRKGLKKETFDLMFSKQTDDLGKYKSNVWGYNEYLAFGFFIEEAPYGNVIRHGGSNGDFWATFRLYDKLNMGYVIMTNGNSGRFIRDNIERNLLNPEELPLKN
ncbi:MAG: serine hydrolase [Flavobacteriaceae bacterium]